MTQKRTDRFAFLPDGTKTEQTGSLQITEKRAFRTAQNIATIGGKQENLVVKEFTVYT